MHPSKKIHIKKLTTDCLNDKFSLIFSTLISKLSNKTIDIPLNRLREITEDKSNVLFIANEDNSSFPVGLICLVVMNLPQGKRYHIESVIVSEPYRGYGIGTKLIEAVISFLAQEQAGHVSLTCNKSRAEALSLYKKVGFIAAKTDVYRYYL